MFVRIYLFLPIDNSKIKKGLVNLGFGILLEIAVTCKLTNKDIIGFNIKSLKGQEG